MIHLNSISKTYKTDEVHTQALNDISFSIFPGDFVSIMGPSGCGKSTLLNILGLLDVPDAGSYNFLENEISNASEKERTLLRKNHIGFVFQSFNLIEELTVFENIELPLLYKKVNKDERKERVKQLIEKMELNNRENHYPHQLSGGQQQRVAVARALVTNPHLILADEPTGNLDSKNGEQVMNLLKKLNGEGTTIVMVTHSEEYAKFAPKVISMLDGKIQKIEEAVSSEV